MPRLHVTGDEHAAARLTAVMGGEPALPWADPLYLGPVREAISLEELTAARVRFLGDRYRLEREPMRARLQDRNRRMREALDAASELIAWFRPGLGDQLQLIQLLDLVAGEAGVGGHLSLCQARTALAEFQPGELKALAASAPPVRPVQLELAQATWAAFRAPTPEALARLRSGDTTALPCLGSALERLLEELPTDHPGLSATERYILEELESGPRQARELLARCRTRERIWFMADWAFFAVLDELASEPLPLVMGPPATGFSVAGSEADRTAYLAAEVRLTHEGRLMREGRLDRTTAKPLDRWLGGTHLTNDSVWRWEPATATLHHG